MRIFCCFVVIFGEFYYLLFPFSVIQMVRLGKTHNNRPICDSPINLEGLPNNNCIINCNCHILKQLLSLGEIIDNVRKVCLSWMHIRERKKTEDHGHWVVWTLSQRPIKLIQFDIYPWILSKNCWCCSSFDCWLLAKNTKHTQYAKRPINKHHVAFWAVVLPVELSMKDIYSFFSVFFSDNRSYRRDLQFNAPVLLSLVSFSFISLSRSYLFNVFCSNVIANSCLCVFFHSFDRVVVSTKNEERRNDECERGVANIDQWSHLRIT